MQRSCCLALSVCLSLGAVSSGGGPDEARAIIDKAIQARGGDAGLAKLGLVRIKGTGKETGNGPEVALTWEQTAQLPDRIKSVQSLRFSGQMHSVTVVIDRDQGWFRSNDQTQEIPAKMLASMKEELYVNALELMLPLRGKEYELSTLPETKVQGRPAVGVKVTSKGHEDVKLFFDKESGFLVKRQRHMDSGMGRKVTEEVVYSDYREAEKMQVPRKLIKLLDGKKVSEHLVTEVQFLDKIDDRVFAKP
jgi:hypothetical protein